MNDKRILYVFTRTPLHVGAGASVGAIDQPIIRERHTGFPVIPGTSLKGTFADAWSNDLLDEENDQHQKKKVRVKNDGTARDAAWLFGSDSDKHPAAGALQFSEARLLAFPVRSARGSFAWITCPLILKRAVRDGLFDAKARGVVEKLTEPGDDHALFPAGKLNLEIQKDGKPVQQVVLEEYTFTCAGHDEAKEVGEAFEKLLDDPVWREIKDRLVILSNGMMSFFTQNACDVAQHVKLDDETGTAAEHLLFNQENVPTETMFYAVVHAFHGRGKMFQSRTPEHAFRAFQGQDEQGKDQPGRPGVLNGSVFQFGGDASTGLGYCTVALSAP